jgi:hypothetical protein
MAKVCDLGFVVSGSHGGHRASLFPRQGHTRLLAL